MLGSVVSCMVCGRTMPGAEIQDAVDVGLAALRYGDAVNRYRVHRSVCLHNQHCVLHVTTNCSVSSLRPFVRFQFISPTLTGINETAMVGVQVLSCCDINIRLLSTKVCT